MESGENASVKEMMQKVAAKFEDKWDIDKSSQFEAKWDIAKNSTFEDKWDINKNSPTKQRKSAAVKEIMQSIAGKLADEWNIKESSARAERKAQKGAVDGAAGKSGTKEDKERTVDKSINNAEKQETGSVKASSSESESSFHPTPGGDAGGNPYVQTPVPTSQSGVEE